MFIAMNRESARKKLYFDVFSSIIALLYIIKFFRLYVFSLFWKIQNLGWLLQQMSFLFSFGLNMKDGMSPLASFFKFIKRKVGLLFELIFTIRYRFSSFSFSYILQCSGKRTKAHVFVVFFSKMEIYVSTAFSKFLLICIFNQRFRSCHFSIFVFAITIPTQNQNFLLLKRQVKHFCQYNHKLDFSQVNSHQANWFLNSLLEVKLLKTKIPDKVVVFGFCCELSGFLMSTSTK